MKKQPNSRMCFVCGLQNPVGLHLAFYQDHASDPKQVRVDILIPDKYQGYPGVAHGGILAAILDELAGRAVLIDGSPDDLMVTLKMELRYRLPTPTETPLTGVGWITRHRGNRAQAHSELRLPDGRVSVEAELVLMRPPGEFDDVWESERPYWRVYPDERERATGAECPLA
jgi:acyl-coenzyme A thioesterase PaaI-like protein